MSGIDLTALKSNEHLDFGRPFENGRRDKQIYVLVRYDSYRSNNAAN